MLKRQMPLSVLAAAQLLVTQQHLLPMEADRLDDMVAPIAPYPDPMLSQILVASTYPLELVQATQAPRWHDLLEKPGHGHGSTSAADDAI